jgi:NAD(P)-dependent dehydrogenase (short-subunit alcohol dehydrogenase family)
MNNAGAIFNDRRVTADGLEMTFATNHMSYFVLTHGLRDRLVASAPARIVNTSSHAHKGGRLDFDDLQMTKSYAGFKMYGRSKFLNVLFTRELARRLAGTGVTANCLHPGFVNTRFGDQAGGSFSGWIRMLKLLAISPQKGAETMIYLASSPDVAKTSGEYFYKSKAMPPSEAAQDDEGARRLWQETAKLAGITE